MVIARQFAYHPIYSQYTGMTGVLVRKDEQLESWWADFKRPREALQKIIDKRKAEEEARRQEAEDGGGAPQGAESRADAAAPGDAGRVGAGQAAAPASSESMDAGRGGEGRRGDGSGADGVEGGKGVNGSAGRGGGVSGARGGGGKEKGGVRVVKLKDKLATARELAAQKARGSKAPAALKPSEELFCCGHNGFCVLALVHKEDDVVQGTDDEAEADDDAVLVDRGKLSVLGKGPAARTATAETIAVRLQALKEASPFPRSPRPEAPESSELKGRVSPTTAARSPMAAARSPLGERPSPDEGEVAPLGTQARSRIRFGPSIGADGDLFET